MNVLIVDDDPDAINLLKRHLENHGFRVLTACNGREALVILHKNDVRLVVTDRIMPVMNGLELCQKIRASNIPGYVYVILLTVCDRREDVVAGINAGADDYLTKPFYSEELTVRIDTGLRALNLEQSLREKIAIEKRLFGELQEALGQVKRLSGLLPICATCKKILDDKGYWNEIEPYICEHSEADFSHGICPECAEKYYPDFFNKEKIK